MIDDYAQEHDVMELIDEEILPSWQPIFEPAQFEAEFKDLQVLDYQLSHDDLHKKALLTADIRKRFKDKADALEMDAK